MVQKYAYNSRMESLSISVAKQIKIFQKNIGTFARDQVPFAASLAINNIAKKIITGERDQIKKTFGPVTPFTLSGFRLSAAKKNNLNATISMMPIQAGYLSPYEGGGLQVPHIKAMLTPKNIQLNEYGNIPYGALKFLKAQKGLTAAIKSKNKSAIAMAQAKLNALGKGANGYFIGPVKTKGGTFGGLWQRINFVQEGDQQRSATKRDFKNLDRSHIQRGLKLIVRFTEPLPVHQQLHYQDRARKIVASDFDAEMAEAYKFALSTAR